MSNRLLIIEGDGGNYGADVDCTNCEQEFAVEHSQPTLTFPCPTCGKKVFCHLEIMEDVQDADMD